MALAEKIDFLEFEEQKQAQEINFSLLRDFIFSEIMDTKDHWQDCVTSFSYVAIQRLIFYCKNNDINLLEMPFDDIKTFVEDNLKKELFN